MPRYGPKSTANLSEAHPDLQRVFNEVIKHVDCSVIEGRRGEAEQNYLFKTGKSQLKFPASNHNPKTNDPDELVTAIDCVPYPVVWDDIPRFKRFCWFVKGVAAGMDIEIVSGGLDWTTFKDFPHFELKL